MKFEQSYTGQSKKQNYLHALKPRPLFLAQPYLLPIGKEGGGLASPASRRAPLEGASPLAQCSASFESDCYDHFEASYEHFSNLCDQASSISLPFEW